MYVQIRNVVYTEHRATFSSGLNGDDICSVVETWKRKMCLHLQSTVREGKTTGSADGFR